ncbi:MAG: hypothetical protein LC772_01570, partial [Chloroflexi bacterium]|nr:hypothetical protein [Chloroflexota bacterium]
LMQVGEAESPRLALGLDVEGAAGQWVIPQMSRLFGLESLSFVPYGMPELLLLEAIPGSDSVRQTIPPLFLREGSADAARQAEEPTAAGAEGEFYPSDPVGAEEAEYDTSPDDAPVSRDDEAASSAPRRRSLWPFRRQR